MEVIVDIALMFAIICAFLSVFEGENMRGMRYLLYSIILLGWSIIALLKQ